MSLTSPSNTGITEDDVLNAFFNNSLIKEAVITDRGVQLFNIPVNVPASIYELIKTGETKYKNFWMWLSMNPNENARQHLHDWVTTNKIAIHESGFLIMFRNVHQGRDGNWYKDLKDQYFKLRGQKKTTKVPIYVNSEWKNPTLNSGEVFSGATLQDLDTKVFTASYDQNMFYVLGQEVRMPRLLGDESDALCSSGFHISGDNYNYTSFGNTTILCLVNPKDVLASVEGASKMRTCAFIPFKIVDDPEERFTVSDHEVNLAINVGLQKIEDAIATHTWGEDGQHWAIEFDNQRFVEFKSMINDQSGDL